MLNDKQIKKIMIEKAGNNFDEECIQPNGVDLRLKELYYWDKTQTYGIMPNGFKMVPELKPVEWHDDDTFHIVEDNCYILDVGEIKTPENIGGLFTLRSTFMRAGLALESAVLDAGYCGNLRFVIHPVATNMDIQVVKNERIVQMVLFELGETESTYNGDYQNNKIYKNPVKDSFDSVKLPESDGYLEHDLENRILKLKNYFSSMGRKYKGE